MKRNLTAIRNTTRRAMPGKRATFARLRSEEEAADCSTWAAPTATSPGLRRHGAGVRRRGSLCFVLADTRLRSPHATVSANSRGRSNLRRRDRLGGARARALSNGLFPKGYQGSQTGRHFCISGSEVQQPRLPTALSRGCAPSSLLLHRQTVKRYLNETGFCLEREDNRNDIFAMPPENWLLYLLKARVLGRGFSWRDLPPTRPEFIQSRGAQARPPFLLAVRPRLPSESDRSRSAARCGARGDAAQNLRHQYLRCPQGLRFFFL